MEYLWILWIAVLIASIVLEAATADLVAIWFFPGALIAMILSFCGAPVAAQLPVFLGCGLLLIFCTRPFCRKFLKEKNAKTNTDTLIGGECMVTEEIDNLKERGEVKIGGLRWSARTEHGEIIPAGALVTVLRIEGVKLIVKPKKEKKEEN